MSDLPPEQKATAQSDVPEPAMPSAPLPNTADRPAASAPSGSSEPTREELDRLRSGARLDAPAEVSSSQKLQPLSDYLRLLLANPRLDQAIRLALRSRKLDRPAGTQQPLPIFAPHPLIALVAAELIFPDRPIRVLTATERSRLAPNGMPIRQFPIAGALREVIAAIKPDDTIILETWGSPASLETLAIQVAANTNGALIAPMDGHAPGEVGVNLRIDDAKLLADIAVAAFDDEDWKLDPGKLRADVLALVRENQDPATVFTLLNQETSDELRVWIDRHVSAGHIAPGVYDFPAPDDDARFAAALFVAAHFSRLDARTFRALAEPLALAMPVRPRKKASRPAFLTDDVLLRANVRFLTSGFAFVDAPSAGTKTTVSGAAQARAWFRDRRLLKDVFIENLERRLVHGHPNPVVAERLRGLEIEALTHYGVRTAFQLSSPLARLLFGYLVEGGEPPAGSPGDRTTLKGNLRASIARAPALLADLKAAVPAVDLRALVAALTRATAPDPASADLMVDSVARLFWTLYLQPASSELRPSLVDFAPSDPGVEREPALIGAFVAELDRILRDGPVAQPDSQAFLVDFGRNADSLFDGDLPGATIFGYGLWLGLLQPLRRVRWDELGTFDLSGAKSSSIVEAAWRCSDVIIDKGTVQRDEGADGDEDNASIFAAFLACRSVIEVVSGCSSLGEGEADALRAFTSQLIPFADVAFDEEPLWQLERSALRHPWMVAFESVAADLQRGVPVAVAMLLTVKPGDGGPGAVVFEFSDDLRRWLIDRPLVDGVRGATRASALYDRVLALGQLGDLWATALQSARVRPTEAGRTMWTHRRRALRQFASSLRALSGR